MFTQKCLVPDEEMVIKFMYGKEHSINTLQLLTMPLEQDMKNAFLSSFSDLTEGQLLMCLLNLKKSKYLKELEDEAKNIIIFPLEKEV